MILTTTAQKFSQEIRTKIPLVGQMGVEITEFNQTQVRLRVPYLPNKNHVNTVFGGALYSACALACYALFRAMAESSGFTEDFLVIQEGQINYLKPVDNDFEVLATPQPHLNLEQFILSVKRSGKGRLPLEAVVLLNGVTCARFTGVYVMRIPRGANG